MLHVNIFRAGPASSMCLANISRIHAGRTALRVQVNSARQQDKSVIAFDSDIPDPLPGGL